MQVSVKMGSNVCKIQINERKNQFSSQDLIETVLEKCKLNKCNSAKTYSVYENVQGVERLVKINESIINLAKNWPLNSSAFFIVRKTKKCQIKPVKKLNNKKCFQLLNKMQHKTEQIEKSIHVYDEIEFNENEQEATNNIENQKQVFLQKILENQVILEKQTEQLSSLENSIQKRVFKESKGVSMCQFHKTKLRNSLESLQSIKSIQSNQNKTKILKSLLTKLKSSRQQQSHSTKSSEGYHSNGMSSSSSLESLV